jgi:hypothetical protein
VICSIPFRSCSLSARGARYWWGGPHHLSTPGYPHAPSQTETCRSSAMNRLPCSHHPGPVRRTECLWLLWPTRCSHRQQARPLSDPLSDPVAKSLSLTHCWQQYSSVRQPANCRHPLPASAVRARRRTRRPPRRPTLPVRSTTAFATAPPPNTIKKSSHSGASSIDMTHSPPCLSLPSEVADKRNCGWSPDS